MQAQQAKTFSVFLKKSETEKEKILKTHLKES